MRILIFIHSLHGGGAERVAADLSAHWAGQGHDVALATQAAADEDAYALHARVRREVLDTAGLSGWRWRGAVANLRRMLALRQLLRAWRPDIVLGMMTTSSVLAILAARGLPCKVIATEHTHPPSQSLPGMWRWLRRYAYPRAARVVALTAGTAGWIEAHVPGSRLTVIPNAVHWPLAQSEPVLVPNREKGRRTFLAVGRLHRDKGFDLLIDAYASVAAQCPDWDLVILGEGAERAALQARIDAARLGARVSMPGRAGNVGQWYEAADAYVLSSRVEGLSNTLLEAMASGLAPVAYDCDTGPREIIRDAVDGILVRPSGDVRALACALGRIAVDDAARAGMARQAMQARTRFSAQHVLALWQAVFDDALDSGGERAGAASSSWKRG